METDTAVRPRPGWVTFASVMLFIIGGISVIVAIAEFNQALWLKSYSISIFGEDFVDYSVLWGIIDITIAVLVVYAAIDILRGGKFGLFVAYLFASIAIIRWFFYFPWAPLASLMMMFLGLATIFGLAGNEEYFKR